MKIRYILVAGMVLFALWAAGCSDESNPPAGDTDTTDKPHLKHCTTNDDCDGALICHTAIDGGVCLEKCDFGLPDAQGDDYCQLFAEGFLCQPKLGYVCTAPCTNNADCDQYVEGSVCNTSTGLCLEPPECQSDSDCENNLKCMKGVWGGRCMVDCTMTWQGKTGDELCAEEAGEGFVCHADGNCAPTCSEDSDCKQINPVYVCNQQGKCERPNSRMCETNSDCEQGEACHGTNSASECLARCTDGMNGVSGDEFCRLIFPGTVCHEALGAACRPPCASDAQCEQYSEGLICSNDHKCIPKQQFMECTTSNDCPTGEVCHAELHIRNQQKGTCAASCTTGGTVEGEILQGDQYCEALLPGSVCNESLGGICQTPCQTNEDCALMGENLVCMNGGMCKDPSTIDGCRDNTDCPSGEVCHAMVENGRCAPDCTTGANGKTDNAYCNDMATNYICHTYAGGVCAPRCMDDSLCSNIGSDLSCRGDGECVPPDTEPVCQADTDCPDGTICHKLVPGAACLPSCATGDGEVSGDEFCQLYTSLGSHCYEAEGGFCMSACESDDDCRILGNDYSCHTQSGLCFRAYMPDTCTTNDDCPYGMVCQQTCNGYKCAAPCNNDEDCPACEGEGFETEPRYCASGNACQYVKDRKTPCRADKDCEVGEVCHIYASDETGDFGVCAPVCEDSEICREKIGSAYVCGHDGRCKKGNSSDLLEEQIACSSDADCPAGFLCSDLIGGKVCLPECNTDSDCNYQPGLFCDQNSRCRRETTRNTPCQTNDDCSKGTVCYQSSNPDNNQCMAPCASDDECASFEAGTFCNALGQCKVPQGTSCVDDSDCGMGNVCHENTSGENVCAPPCTNDDDCISISASLTCTSNGVCKKTSSIQNPCVDDSDCPFGTVCMNRLEPAICAEACNSDADCQALSETYVCGADNKCIDASLLNEENCTTDMDCRAGEACHDFFGVCSKRCEHDSDCTESFGPGFVCFENGQCAPPEKQYRTCEQDSQCPAGQVCHTAAGKCAPPCSANEDCTNLGLEYCNGNFECTNNLHESNCHSDAECPAGKVCHTDLDITDNNGNPIGLCLPPCTSSANCNEVSLNYECRADNRCHMISMEDGCTSNSDCYPGNICHSEASENGVCAAPCTGQGDCARFAEDLYCSQQQECIPIPQSR